MEKISFKNYKDALLIIIIYVFVVVSPASASSGEVLTGSQELEERLHTDWTIIDFSVSPSDPAPYTNVTISAICGIHTIIDPLPQEVEATLMIDGVEFSSYSLIFEKDPTSVINIQAIWTALPGTHHIKFIIDPNRKYADPDLSNNHAELYLNVPILTLTEITTTTLTETQVITSEKTQTMIITETTTHKERLSETVKEIITHTMISTLTKTESEKITEESMKNNYVLMSGLTVIAALLGLIIGRKSAPKLKFLNLMRQDRLPSEAIFSCTRYRWAKQLSEEEWEAKPGEKVEDAKGIIAIDENGNVTIVHNHSCIYSSRIEKRPLTVEDLSKLDKQILEGLLEQLKSTRQTTIEKELELNEAQKNAIEDLIQKMEKELKRRPPID